ncbi:hypothetical protein HY492_04025 [Candidatus Woesearchaeota archaeon]|nr:hypothetical protein [Candidatus Woesearchaeota archaeon]
MQPRSCYFITGLDAYLLPEFAAPELRSESAARTAERSALLRDFAALLEQCLDRRIIDAKKPTELIRSRECASIENHIGETANDIRSQ